MRLALPLCLLLVACSEDASPVGGVTAEEAAQLNNAAEMLDVSGEPAPPPAE